MVYHSLRQQDNKNEKMIHNFYQNLKSVDKGISIINKTRLQKKSKS